MQAVTLCRSVGHARESNPDDMNTVVDQRSSYIPSNSALKTLELVSDRIDAMLIPFLQLWLWQAPRLESRRNFVFRGRVEQR